MRHEATSATTQAEGVRHLPPQSALMGEEHQVRPRQGVPPMLVPVLGTPQPAGAGVHRKGAVHAAFVLFAAAESLDCVKRVGCREEVGCGAGRTVFPRRAWAGFMVLALLCLMCLL